MRDHYDVLIVGAGHGGAQTATALRQRGYEGTIGLLGDEPELPYDRPPLSKEYLSGGKPWERVVFRSAEAWTDLGVTLLLGSRVVAVNTSERVVAVSDGRSIGYGKLVWATGGAARRIACEGHVLRGVHTVRNRADVDRMVEELPSVSDVVVIGGGYIGLEAAAVLQGFGKRITVIEAMDRVLARVAGEPLSRFYEAEHRARGVDVRLNVQVDAILGEDRVSGVRTVGGEVIPAQMVIVGIGIIPEIGPLRVAGCEIGNGVRVDEQCRTSLPDIFAVGDCAEHRNAYAVSEWVRLESVQNANDQATVVAGAILGGTESYTAVPWFWSNQYDLKLQTVGLSAGFDELIVRGVPADRSFSVVYLRSGKVVALDCVNSVRDYSHGRLLVQAGSRPVRDLLGDPTIPLKTLL